MSSVSPSPPVQHDESGYEQLRVVLCGLPTTEEQLSGQRWERGDGELDVEGDKGGREGSVELTISASMFSLRIVKRFTSWMAADRAEDIGLTGLPMEVVGESQGELLGSGESRASS